MFVKNRGGFNVEFFFIIIFNPINSYQKKKNEKKLFNINANSVNKCI